MLIKLKRLIIENVKGYKFVFCNSSILILYLMDSCKQGEVNQKVVPLLEQYKKTWCPNSHF